MLVKSRGDAQSGRRVGRAQGGPLADVEPSRAELARLCSFLQQAADEHKRRLARALHDAPAQTVSAALLTLFLLEREKAALSESAQRALEDAQSLLSNCGEELRQLSHELYPPLLDEVGLQPALRTLVRKVGAGRIRLQLDEVPRLSRRAEEAAYRVAEEALTGVLASKGAVDLQLAPAGRQGLSLALAGRARPAGPGRRLALMAIEQRVRDAGGVLSLRPTRGRLQLEVRFPGQPSLAKKMPTRRQTRPKKPPKTKMQPLAFRGTEGQLRRGGR